MKWACDIIVGAVITCMLIVGGLALVRLFDEWVSAVVGVF